MTSCSYETPFWGNTSTRKPHKKFYMPHFKECNSARRVQQLVIQFFFYLMQLTYFGGIGGGYGGGGRGGPASNLTIIRTDYYPPPGINKSPHLTQGSNMPKYLRNAVVLAQDNGSLCSPCVGGGAVLKGWVDGTSK